MEHFVGPSHPAEAEDRSKVERSANARFLRIVRGSLPDRPDDLPLSQATRIPAHEPDPLHQLIHQSEAVTQRRRLQSALAALDADDLDLIRLRYLQHASLADLASLMNMPRARMQKRLSGILVEIRRLLETQQS